MVVPVVVVQAFVRPWQILVAPAMLIAQVAVGQVSCCSLWSAVVQVLVAVAGCGSSWRPACAGGAAAVYQVCILDINLVFDWYCVRVVFWRRWFAFTAMQQWCSLVRWWSRWRWFVLGAPHLPEVSVCAERIGSVSHTIFMNRAHVSFVDVDGLRSMLRVQPGKLLI